LLEASIRVRVFAETVRGPAPTSLDPGGGLLAFVAQKLGVAQSRVTVDCGVREVVAANRVAVPRCPSPRGSAATDLKVPGQQPLVRVPIALVSTTHPDSAFGDT
jgi:hypothetical protein